MKTIIIIFILASLSCATTHTKNNSIDIELYSNAFCELMDIKQRFKSPNNISRDTIFIVDEYYLDTTSLLYNQMNLGFQIGFINTTKTSTLEDQTYAWNRFKNINSFRDKKYTHKQNLQCLQTLKIKFIKERDLVNIKDQNRTFVYSPLFELKDNKFVIYEQSMSRPSDYYYSYFFQRVGDRFEFIEREYSSDMHISIQEDFIKNVNFNQSLEQYLRNRNY